MINTNDAHNMTGRTVLSCVVTFLAVAGIGASVFFLVSGGANEGFLLYPTTVYLHIFLGALYLALAPFQFSARVRKKSLDYHRWSGRLLSAIGMILGMTAVFIGLVIPFSGLPEQIIIGFFGLLFLFSITRGFYYIRVKQVRLHREWMLRAFAIGLSIATMRLLFIPALIIVGNPTQSEIEALSIISFTLAFFLHCSFAEYWIRATRTVSA
ncbi:MAG: DUF2306 domain-containing protein [Proteobacteria bacterium]|nr:DUF2306 domain-containing protein [Pseudomonadota bacterium]